MMNIKTKIVIGLLGAGLLVGGGVAVMGGDKIELVDPQKIVWDKPTTDEEWAEDVKKENFDIKSDGVLDKMIESSTSKLERLEKDFVKYVECPECTYWHYKELFDAVHSKESESWRDEEATRQAQNDYDQRLYEIEKIKQSIERMNKELELRDKGFVIVDDGEKKLGGNKIIRKIND